MEELDRAIVRLLAADGRMSYTDLGKATGLSTSAVHQRVRRLEQRGVIKGYTIAVDHDALGLPLTALISIKPIDPAAPDDAPAKLPDDFAQLNPNAQEQVVARLVCDLLVQFLKIDAGAVSDERPFFDLGMDSVSAVEFSSQLDTCFALDLHVDTIFDYPSVAALTGYLLERLAAAHAPHELADTAAQADAALPIDELSALLRQEMGDD